MPPPAVCCAAPEVPARGWRIEAAEAAGSSLRRLVVASAAAQSATPVAADDAPVDDEWMMGSGVGWSLSIIDAEGGRGYVPVTVSWTHDVMTDRGPGLLRGRLSWGVEVMPLYAQFRPTSTIGVGLTPLLWRWRLVPRRNVIPFAELSFGGLFTRDAVPEDTVRRNFIAHGGIGVRWQPQRRLGVAAALRFQHISNGNQLTSNPGVNAPVLWVGVSLRGSP